MVLRATEIDNLLIDIKPLGLLSSHLKKKKLQRIKLKLNVSIIDLLKSQI